MQLLEKQQKAGKEAGKMKTGKQKIVPNRCDISNKRFGKLVALYPTGEKSNKSCVWHCRCDCGNYIDVTVRNLNRGTKSCGCLKHKAPEEYHSIKNNLHLVEGTCIENLIASQKCSVKSSTGIRGVYLQKKTGKYVATLDFQKQRHYLGTFKEIKDAAQARREAEKVYFENFLENYEGGFK
jgi:hypothetical protein